MYYFVGSMLPIEWTNQHSCGQENNDCDIVLQYMCSPDLRDGTSSAPDGEKDFVCLLFVSKMLTN